MARNRTFITKLNIASKRNSLTNRHVDSHSREVSLAPDAV